jgi:hypothetical protein
MPCLSRIAGVREIMALPWSFVSKITNSKHQITNKPACHCELARQPSPPGIRLRRSRWRPGKARRPGVRAGRSQLEQWNDGVMEKWV